METPSVDVNTNSNTRKVWDQMRFYGNIVLIIAMLVIVFGQAIGGGLIDAYTAKKVLPRILVAAVLLNLSIYIVSVTVDITNLLGRSLNSLIIGAFDQAGQATFKINGSTSGLLGLGAIAGAGGSIWLLAVHAGAVIQFLLVFILLPAILTFLAVMSTLIIRLGIIEFLIIISPIAFALYCLPNTERYYKQWWSLLFKTALVYPIVAVVFAMASVLALTINQTNGGLIGDLIKIILLVIPLFLIPFAFKMSGGAIGSLYGTLSGLSKKTSEAIKGSPNNPRSLRNSTRYKMQSAVTDERGRAYDALSARTMGGNSRRFRRGVAGGLARVVGIGNLEAQRAQMNKEQNELTAAQYSTGGDNTIRAFWAKQHAGPNQAVYDSTGQQVQTLQKGAFYSPYKGDDGKYKEWSAADVAKSKSLVGKDTSKIQGYAIYELSKNRNQQEVGAFKSRFAEVANESGWTPSVANGVWSGIKFNHQQTRREEKHSTISGEKGSLHFNTGGPTGSLRYGDINQAGLSEELVDSVRNFDFANFRPGTAEAAIEGWQRANGGDLAGSADGNKARDNYKTLAQALQIRIQRGGRMLDSPEGGAEGSYDLGSSTGASARAEEKWREFVGLVQPPPPPKV